MVIKAYGHIERKIFYLLVQKRKFFELSMIKKKGAFATTFGEL